MNICSTFQSEKEDEEKLMPPPAPVTQKSPKVRDLSKEKRPLASMLPEKYKDTDVKDLFPEFRQCEVLRFSRLFPVKDSHRPKLWKGLKRKKKKEEPTPDLDTPLSTPDVLEEEKELKLEIAPFPDDPEMYQEDMAERLHRIEIEKKEEGLKEGEEKNEKRGPKASDWRWGPAQYWYDMLNLPENVEEYDYGLQSALDHMNDEVQRKEFPQSEVKQEDTEKALNKENQKPKMEKIEIHPDAFLMVTQSNWEEDVIWNGDDIRHKVMQKLNNKTNAAGWVPTGFQRTAGNFSQAAGASGPGGKAGLPGIKLQTLQHKRTDGDDTFYSIFPVENEDLVYGRWEDEVIWDAENMPKKLKPKMVSLDPNDDNIILGIPDDIDPSTLPSDVPQRKVKIIQKHVKQSRMLLNKTGRNERTVGKVFLKAAVLRPCFGQNNKSKILI